MMVAEAPARTPASSQRGATSALQGREFRRSSQRCVRLALNAVNRGRDQWEEASASGRTAASDASNSILEESQLHTISLGVLADMPGLLEAASEKLKARQLLAHSTLTQSIERLEAALSEMEWAAASASDLSHDPGSPPELVCSAAVFHALPLGTFVGLFREMADMFRQELAVNRLIARGLGELSYGEAVDRRRPGSESTKELTATRAQLQVYLAAWLLEPEIDKDRLVMTLGIIEEEMKGF